MRKAFGVLLASMLVMAAVAFSACGSAAGSTTSDRAASKGTTSSSSSPSSSTASTAETSLNEESTTTQAGDAYGPDGYRATATSYTSATKTITIREGTAGTGDHKMVYFAADIRLKDSTDLRSVFSNGTYRGKAEETSTIAEANDALVAINGDYYRARNDGIVIRDGVLYRDVPARTGLAIYKNGTMKIYDEKDTTGEQLLADGVWNTFSFGPGLLTHGAIADGLDTYQANSNPELSIQGHNPRTGIGMIKSNHFIFVVVDGRSSSSRGATLTEFAQIFQDLGCNSAYNLDGGGSSTLYFMGKVVNHPSGKNGERIVSDILFVE